MDDHPKAAASVEAPRTTIDAMQVCANQFAPKLPGESFAVLFDVTVDGNGNTVKVKDSMLDGSPLESCLASAMDRKTAEKLNAITLESYFKIHDAVDVVRNGMPESDERKEYVRGLGRALGYLYTDVLSPIYNEYPDLKPDNIA